MDGILPLSLAIALLAVAVAYAAWLAIRMARQGGRVRLFEVLQGSNLAAPDFVSEASMLAGAYAVRRCVTCGAQADCDAMIARRDWTALAAICPNRDYLDKQRQPSR